MNVVHTGKAKRFLAALGISAAATVTPLLLFSVAGTAHAQDEDPCYGPLQYSFYCHPASGAGGATDLNPPDPFAGPPSTNLWPALPGCTGGVLQALDGEC